MFSSPLNLCALILFSTMRHRSLLFFMTKELLTQLIAFKTLSRDHATNRQALGWIKKELKKLPLYFTEKECGGFPSLLVTTRKTKKPLVWLQAHVDVVPGAQELFTPREQGGRLYGRGAFDMKFAIACYIKLFKELGQNLPEYDFGMMLTTDEEVGGFNGVKMILDEGYSSKVCFLPDCGGANWEFEQAAKGVCHFLVTSKGKSSHASRPWLGVNAIDRLVMFLNALKQRTIIEPCCDGQDHYHTTMNIGKIEGGEAVNSVPEMARVWVDVRFIHAAALTEVRQSIQEIRKDFLGIKVEELMSGPSYSIDTQEYYHQLFQRLAKEYGQVTPRFSVSHGSSDARFFMEKGIPTILVRPKGDGHHGPKEWVDIKDLERFYGVLKIFVEQAAKLG